MDLQKIGIINSCKSSANVEGHGRVGGLVGYKIMNSYATGNVSGL
ncbi:MAG: GLUG motif-containing protein [bacterium]